MTRKCRSCKQPKWQGDVCNNPDCKKAISPPMRLTNKLQQHITATTKHGFHEPGVQEMTGYEPILTDAILFSSEEVVVTPEHSDIAAEILPDMVDWNGQPIPREDYTERMTARQHTLDYWKQAHEENNEWHQRFPGYCMHCSDVTVWNI